MVSKPSLAVLLAATFHLVGAAAAAAPPAKTVGGDWDRAAVVVKQADALLKRRDVRGACRAYRRAHRLVPGWWRARQGIVRCGRAAGIPLTEVIGHARAVIAEHPAFYRFHLQLAGLLEEAGDAAGALAAYLETLAREPAHRGARFRSAVLLERLGRLTEAADAYERLLLVAPRYTIALARLAGVGERLGRLDAAETALATLTERSRYPSQALGRLVRFYERHSMADKAKAARERYRMMYVR